MSNTTLGNHAVAFNQCNEAVIPVARAGGMRMRQ